MKISRPDSAVPDRSPAQSGDSQTEVKFEFFVPSDGQQDRVLGTIPVEVFIDSRESITSDLSGKNGESGEPPCREPSPDCAFPA